MKRAKANSLQLGSNVVAMLLPHRRPLLLVDQITEYCDADVPRLRASKFISGNEPIFEGHFPGLHLWPGVFTLEGLGQSCYLLYLILIARRKWSARGGDADDVIKALLNLERGTRLRPGFDPDLARRFIDEAELLQSRVGVSSAVDVKFLQPVFAGSRLDYHVQLTRDVEQHVRYDVQAEVEGAPVARGTMTSFIGYPNPLSMLDR